MTPTDRDALREQLIRHEGIRLRVYRDSVGIETIGVGRNLRDVGISYGEAMILLDHDIDAATAGLVRAMPWTLGLDLVRFQVLVNMAFNLGVSRLLGFVHTLDAIKRGDYSDAADGMLASQWARQVGHRAEELARQMRTGSTMPPGTLVA